MKIEDEIIQDKFRNPEHKLTVNLIFTYYWLLDKFKMHLKQYDISMQQYNILRILRGQVNKPASINLLKERMLDRSSDASRLVERLRLKGLVERVVCPSDRRAVEIRITPKGLDILQKIDENEERFNREFCPLDKSEVNELNDLLDRLRG